MRKAFFDVNGVRTSVLSFGRWINDTPKSSEPEDIILIIPGNPGVTGFYKMFMHTIHEKTGFPVWIVGHAGHEVPKNQAVYQIQPLKGHENIFGMKGQIEHKRDFINKYVPENARLHLIGHSIGSYIIVELLKDETIKSKVVEVDLLFPTIENMADTPNGKFMTTFVKPIIWLILFLSWIYTILPSVLQNFLMYLYMRVVCMPKMHFRTLVNFIDPTVLEKVFFMAFEELDQVKERDNATISTNINKLRLLYARSDGWAPPKYCDKLIEDFPGIKAENSDFEHAFVLKQSRQVGNFVGKRIATK